MPSAKFVKVTFPERSPPSVITGDLLIVTPEAISPLSKLKLVVALLPKSETASISKSL